LPETTREIFALFTYIAQLPVSVSKVIAKLPLGGIMAFAKGFKFRVLRVQVG